MSRSLAALLLLLAAPGWAGDHIPWNDCLVPEKDEHVALKCGDLHKVWFKNQCAGGAAAERREVELRRRVQDLARNAHQ